MNKHTVLITGCGRSGTTYISKLLCKCGLDIPHEKLGKDGSVSSSWCIDTNEYPGYANSPGSRPDFDVILHQVRHPLKSIASLTTSLESSWRFNAKHVPGLETHQPVIEKSARYWLWWNMHAETQAVMSYRIEDLDQAWPHLTYYLGMATRPYHSVENMVSKTANHRKHREVSWKDLGPFKQNVRTLAHHYGY